MTPWRGWRPPQSLSGFVLSSYESSALRSLLYPLERWAMRVSRRISRRYVSVVARRDASASHAGAQRQGRN
jgi:hypothetical protein